MVVRKMGLATALCYDRMEQEDTCSVVGVSGAERHICDMTMC